MSLGFYFNNARCTGCRTCVVSCADYHDLQIGRKYRRVIDIEGGTTAYKDDHSQCVSTTAYAYHVSLACNHCEHPECMHVCPTSAMHKNELGLVVVDEKRCIGCGYCTIACPYHAPSIDPILQQSSKCDGCSDRVVEGKNPICVDACPLRALEFGDIEKLSVKYPHTVQCVMPLPSEKYTKPCLLIEPGPAALMAQPGEFSISNIKEIENNFTEHQLVKESNG